ncbi:MAG TPA: 2-amino-4-hydroxy-6-hydroxymethyldihydropteridine diphosphokinase [Kiritimatiellia bacterium]|nr:2-amino-4-hydroxy-6-hydroxymethyldihydropteridine diphosphokinase [Kiritimatiellia bacterium]
MSETRILEIGLGFGSNQGDRIANLKAAKASVLALPGVEFLEQSSLYETEPIGVKEEYRHLKFINAVLVILCPIPLLSMQQEMMKIEAGIGRRRTEDQYAPRPLDIDMLYAGSLIIDSPTLKLPHPQCLKRRFVLQPLAEVRPELVLATTNLTIEDLLAGLPAGEEVVKLPDIW